MKIREFATCALAALACASVTATPVRADDVVVNAPNRANLSDWLEATTKHFVIVGEMSDSEIRRRAIRLEQIHALLAKMAPERSENRLTIYLTDGVDPIKRMAHMNNIAGYYVPTAMGAFAVSPRSMQNVPRGFTPEVVLFHEYTHHMLLQSNDDYFPGWVTEGLAELFATADIKPNGDILVGAANQSRAAGMFSMNRWPIERMLRSDTLKLGSDETIEKYTRGGLLVHYLLMNNANAPMFGKFIGLVNHGTDPVEAGKQAFGDLDALDRKLDVYRRQPKVSSVLYAASSIPYAAEITMRNLRNDEAEALPLRLQSETDEDREHPTELLPAARRLGTKFPGSAVAQQTIAQIEYEAGNYAEAGLAADRALALDPNNIGALLTKGRVLGQNALKTRLPADWAAARGQFIKANRLDPNNPFTFVLLYDSYLAAGQNPGAGAVTGLRRAVVLAPQDGDVRIRMALQQIREGDIAGARLMLAPVAFSPHGKADAPAAKFYPILAAGGDSATLLAKAIELKLPVNSFFPKKPADKPEAGKSGS
jgi:tetratricopeptide (TPR) repeat protein